MDAPEKCRLACVDVGSGALEMLVVQADATKAETLDALRRSVALGRDCYAAGVISRESIRETCAILNGFSKLLKEYRVDEVRVVGTSALREAANRDWVLDRIRLNTGFSVEVLGNGQERYLAQCALAGNLPGYEAMGREGMLVADVGYGSCEITEFRQGRMRLSLNVKLGALRLWELIASVAKENPRYPELLEEMILSALEPLGASMKVKDITHFVALSGEMDALRLLSGKRVTNKRFDQLYRTLKGMTPERMQREYGMRPERAEILLPTIMVIRAFLDMTGAQELHLSGASLKEGIIKQMRARRFALDDGVREEEDILSLARGLGAREQYDRKHAQDVETKAMRLFDALRPLHGLTGRDRLLLRLSAILHDIGKRVSISRHAAQSANIIAANPLLGLSDEEMRTLRSVVMRHTAHDLLTAEDAVALPDGRRLAADKLLALLKLADVMDKSRKQKLTLEEVALCEDALWITASANQDAALEKWLFEQTASSFADLYGVQPKLKIVRA